MPDKVTIRRLKQMQERGEPIVALTAYDALFGAFADAAGVDIVLVGDSVGNVLLGHSTTVPVNLEDMVHHTKATRAGVSRALLLADLPFGSYEGSTQQAVESAVALMKAGAEAVKLEGDYPEAVRAMTRAGIPVVGHSGMTPQSVNLLGGHRVQGRGEASDDVRAEVQRLQDAGAIGVVLELIPAELAATITREAQLMTIGIGAGPHCHGQVQVLSDILGLSPRTYRHARAFMNGSEAVLSAFQAYSSAVRNGEFPTQENSV